MPRLCSLLLSCACLLLLSGCGEVKGAGDLLPVLSAAIAREDDGYVLTVEAVRQDSLDGSAAPVYLTAHAQTPDDLFEQTDRMLGDRLYLSHARTLMIDESIAADGLDELAACLLARGDLRLTLRVAVARGVSADALVRAEAVTEEIPGAALGTLLDNHARSGYLPDLPLCRLIDRLRSGAGFSLPALTLSADGRVMPAGQANFPRNVFTGFSGGDDLA